MLDKAVPPREAPPVRPGRPSQPGGGVDQAGLAAAAQLRPAVPDLDVHHGRGRVAPLLGEGRRGNGRGLHGLRHHGPEDAAEVKRVDEREAVKSVAYRARVGAADERLGRERGRIRDRRGKGQAAQHVRLNGARDGRHRLARQAPARRKHVHLPPPRVSRHHDAGDRDGGGAESEGQLARHRTFVHHERVGRSPDEASDQRVGQRTTPQHEPAVPIGLRAHPAGERQDPGAGQRLVIFGGHDAPAYGHLGLERRRSDRERQHRTTERPHGPVRT